MIFSSQLGKINTASPQEGIAQVANHIRKMQEELEYRLMNLSSDNINEIDMSQTTILSGDAQLTQIIQQTSGQYSAISQKVSGIDAIVTNLRGDMATVVRMDGEGLHIMGGDGRKPVSAGLSEDVVQTLITGRLVSSPTIMGGEFFDLYGKGRLILSYDEDFQIPLLAFDNVTLNSKGQVESSEEVFSVSKYGNTTRLLLDGQVIFTIKNGDLGFGDVFAEALENFL